MGLNGSRYKYTFRKFKLFCYYFFVHKNSIKKPLGFWMLDIGINTMPKGVSALEDKINSTEQGSCLPWANVEVQQS